MSRRRDEHGATMVILGISIVTLLLITSLVVDGGRAYVARRTAQNAVDVAALAGTQALYSHRYAVANGGLGSPSSIWTAVQAKLNDNNAPVDQACDFINAAGVATGYSCASGTTTGADGVRVTASLQQNMAFAQKGGPKFFSAKATASATSQPLKATSSPFIVCGIANGSFPILNPVVPGQPATINVANALAAGAQPIQAAQIERCGAGAAFKGKAEPNQEMHVGDYAAGSQGNGYDAVIRDTVAGATPCPTTSGTNVVVNCDMLLPIADTGYGNGNDIHLHVAAFGIFHVEGDGHGNPKYTARFVAPAVLATGGTGAAGTACVYGSEVCVVKLLA